jgi:hypothetical protein
MIPAWFAEINTALPPNWFAFGGAEKKVTGILTPLKTGVVKGFDNLYNVIKLAPLFGACKR